MVNLGGNTGRLNSSRLYSVWIKHGHFADAKPCGKSMDKSRRLDIAHRFATLDHPLTTLRQGKFMRKSLTKNSTTTDTNRVIFSSRNHIKTTQEIVLFPPVFCPTIGGRFIAHLSKIECTNDHGTDITHIGVISDRTRSVDFSARKSNNVFASDAVIDKPQMFVGWTVEDTLGERSIEIVWMGDIPAACADQAHPVDLIPCSWATIDLLYQLRQVVDKIQTKSLQTFIHTLFSDLAIMKPFVSAPASWKHHHNGTSGLLEHSIEVARITEATATALSTPLPRHMLDLAIVGALLHDLGKVHYVSDPFSRSLHSHNALALELLSPHLKILQELWKDGATALRHIFVGSDARSSPSMPILTMIKSADKISAINDRANTLFAERSRKQNFAKHFPNAGPADYFWRPILPPSSPPAAPAAAAEELPDKSTEESALDQFTTAYARNAKMSTAFTRSRSHKRRYGAKRMQGTPLR